MGFLFRHSEILGTQPVAVLGALLVAVIVLVPSPRVALATDRPNIVLLLVDDLGWADVGCYGNTFIDTPHIDRLAREGVRFTDFYAAGAVCSPTRAAIQSGQNQARVGITAHIPGHWRPFEKVVTPLTTMALPGGTVTPAESLKKAGYATGYVGKWHLGQDVKQGPGTQGYDFAATVGGPHLPGRYRVTNRKDLAPKSGQYRTDFEADLADRFIQKHKDGPFFLMVSPFAVHIPLGAMGDKVAKYRAKPRPKGGLPHPVYAALVEHVDDMVGRMTKSLEAAGVAKNTVFVFTSDNGGLHRRYDYVEGVDPSVTSNAPLRDEKGSLYEGGIRVPLIIRYPGKARAGATCSAVTISYDFYATFLELAGAAAPEGQPLDGKSLVPLLKDPSASLDRGAIHFHYPHYHHSRPAGAIRAGRYKLIQFFDDSSVELYDLAEDIGEKRNLAASRPAKARELAQALVAWRGQVGAKMPTANPKHDANRAAEWWSLRTKAPINSAARRPFPATPEDDARLRRKPAGKKPAKPRPKPKPVPGKKDK